MGVWVDEHGADESVVYECGVDESGVERGESWRRMMSHGFG